MLMSRGQKLVAMALAKASTSKINSTEIVRANVLNMDNNNNSSTQKENDTHDETTTMFIPCTMKITETTLNHEKNIENGHGDEHENNIECETDFDDSDVDPNYLPSNECSEINQDVDSDTLEDMATALENNLESFEIGNRESRKRKRNCGEAYSTRTGKYVRAREVIKLQPCKRKCNSKVTYEDQLALFNQYWGLQNYNLRQAFMTGMIVIEQKKTERKCKSSTAPRNRVYSYSYFLEIRGNRIQVCQKCLRLTVCESEQFLKTVIKKKIESLGTVVALDKRGSHTPGNKITNEKIMEVIEFVNSFPRYESHYSRRHTQKQYLQSDLSISLLYRMYCEKFQQPVSLSKFTEVFKSLNIEFKRPKLDKCHKCETLNMKIKNSENHQENSDFKIEHDNHIREAERAYESKRTDKLAGKSNKSIKVYTFDLQQCLPTPYLQSSVSFYKRPLWTFNLTIHDCVDNQAYCMMWHEAIANRGGNEIASCLFEHLLHLPDIIKHLVFYSDCCAGQNKNSFLVVMFQVLIQILPHLEIIDHKFLVPGHTHMECDSDHALIEKKKKKSTIPIHHPHDWYNFVRSVGVKNGFLVTEMSQEQFLNFSGLCKEKFMWRKSNTEGERFLWRNIKWLRYTRDMGIIHYKTTLEEQINFKVLNIRRRGVNALRKTDLNQCYTEPIKINKKKKEDLLDMLPLINQNFHSFYKDLVTDQMPDFDPDLSEESESEQ